MNEKGVKKGMKNTVRKYAKKFMIIHVDKLLFIATSCTFIFAKETTVKNEADIKGKLMKGCIKKCIKKLFIHQKQRLKKTRNNVG